jgi:thiamine-monophosphate kinase
MSDSDERDESIAGIGKSGLIRRLLPDTGIKNKSTVTGAGDDAAVLDYGRNAVVVSTDILTEGIHFSLVYNPLKHLGYKAAVINFSDIYAMNAVPKQLLVSVALSSRFKVKMVEELYTGIKLACDYYGADLVGGDVTSSLTGLTISCTAIGEGESGRLVYRNGAQMNDLVCITGDLGSAYMGLQILERERVLFEKKHVLQPVLEGYDYVLERQLKPEARREIIEFFRESEIMPTSMIDISDGLSSEIRHICAESRKGCRIYPAKIPVHPETKRTSEEMNIEPMVTALHGGEDYELLFTIKQQDYDKIALRNDISVIGHIVGESNGIFIVTDSGDVELTAHNWDTI